MHPPTHAYLSIWLLVCEVGIDVLILILGAVAESVEHWSRVWCGVFVQQDLVFQWLQNDFLFSHPLQLCMGISFFSEALLFCSV